MRKVFVLLGILALSAAMPTITAGETPLCRSVEQAARANMMPVAMLTRLFWVESRFQADAISSAGAQGVAQFMPSTAAERGPFNPFIPEQAISHAARFLADLDLQFGNLGFSVASYNAGPGRVAKWLAGDDALPRQTRNFVLIVTGHTVEEWAAVRSYRTIDVPAGSQSCSAILNTGFNIDRRSVLLGGLESSGRLLPELRRSGRLLPDTQRSGTLLPGMERKGRLTPEAKRSGSAITASFGHGPPNTLAP